MKKWIAVIAVGIVGAVAWCLFSPPRVPGWETPEGISFGQERKIRGELKEILSLLPSGALERESLEALLIEAGFGVEDTDPVYPAYLANGEALRAFAQAEEETVSVLQVGEDRLFHLFFSRDGEAVLVLTTLSPETREVADCEVLPLYEAELAPWEVFYYRCYPKNDPHYLDYNTFRLTPPDREKYDLTRTYILPVGYQMVNLFLCDWQEGTWENVSINDTFEYLYALETGEDYPWQDIPPQENGMRPVPAQVFEDALLPYFAISREELRQLCRYDEATDTYPWKPVHGNALTVWGYPYRQPEVVEVMENRDGTLTLTVQVGSPDVKTNHLFTHKLTIRQLPQGGFQFVGNEIASVGSWGLPPAMARFALQ